MSVWDAAVNTDGPFLVGIASPTMTGYILCIFMKQIKSFTLYSRRKKQVAIN